MTRPDIREQSIIIPITWLATEEESIYNVIRRHDKSARKGQYVLPDADRLFNPSRETAKLLIQAAKIGPAAHALAHEIFARCY